MNTAPSLTDLFAEAIEALPAAKAAITGKMMNAAIDQASRSMRALYRDPANWTRTRGLGLYDARGNFLGVYGEYRHLKVANCRKLLREEGGEIDAVETLSI